MEWIFEKWGAGLGLDQSGSGLGQVAGSCKCGNECSGSIEFGKFPDSAPRSKYMSNFIVAAVTTDDAVTVIHFGVMGGSGRCLRG